MMIDVTGMATDDVRRALCMIRPDAEWALRGSSLEWLDQVQAEPTLQEITDGILADVKERKIAAAWTEKVRRFAAATVTVTVGGAERQYGCDENTRENVTAFNNMIARDPGSVPNPRPFTPRGGTPVMTTHAEFLAIMQAGMSKGDQFYGAYFLHKSAIQALGTVEAIDAYDLSTGWPE